MTDDIYKNQVADIIAAQPRPSSFAPTTPIELFIKRRRAPTSLDDLEPIEQRQMARMWRHAPQHLRVRFQQAQEPDFQELCDRHKLRKIGDFAY